MLLRLLSILALFAASVASLRADDKPLERAELDKRAKLVAHDIAAHGTELYNKGNQEGCYRLYEGSLWALRAALDHRPDLVKLIEAKLATAKASAKPADQAHALREALDEVIIVCGGLKKPLWDRLGGQKAIEALVHDVATSAAEDPKVNFTRGGKFKPDAEGLKKLEGLLVDWISSVTGGPLKYTGKEMKKAHEGMMITDAEFDALAGIVTTALKKHRIPKAESDDFLAIVAASKKDIVEQKK